jgi:AcrR family transcriptional regulator
MPVVVARSEQASGVQRRWRGREPGDRVAARRAQLVEAGLELMGTAGAHAVSMRGVCRQAGLTERYFYESFGHVDELLIEILDLVVLQARDTLLAATRTAPEQRGPLIRHGVRAFTDFLLADRRRGRVMFTESQATPALAARGAELIAEFTGPIAAVLRPRGRPEGPETETALSESDVQLNALAIFGALAFLYQRWLGPDTAEKPALTEERFIEYVAQVIEQLARASSTPTSGLPHDDQ